MDNQMLIATFEDAISDYCGAHEGEAHDEDCSRETPEAEAIGRGTGGGRAGLTIGDSALEGVDDELGSKNDEADDARSDASAECTASSVENVAPPTAASPDIAFGHVDDPSPSGDAATLAALENAWAAARDFASAVPDDDPQALSHAWYYAGYFAGRCNVLKSQMDGDRGRSLPGVSTSISRHHDDDSWRDSRSSVALLPSGALLSLLASGQQKREARRREEQRQGAAERRARLEEERRKTAEEEARRNGTTSTNCSDTTLHTLACYSLLPLSTQYRSQLSAHMTMGTIRPSSDARPLGPRELFRPISRTEHNWTR